MIKYAIGLGLISAKHGDKAKAGYGSLIKETAKLLVFNVKKDRLDDFFFNKLCVAKHYPELARLMRYIFCLSHGQAAVERGFSHNKTVLQNSIQCKSVKSKRMVKDYLISNGIRPHEVKVTTEMKQSVRSANAKYNAYKAEVEKANKAKEASLATQNIQKDIADMVAKKECLVKVVQSLKEQAKESFVKAESSQSLSFVTAGNALNSRADEKEKEIAELADLINVAQQKLKKSV